MLMINARFVKFVITACSNITNFSFLLHVLFMEASCKLSVGLYIYNLDRRINHAMSFDRYATALEED